MERLVAWARSEKDGLGQSRWAAGWIVAPAVLVTCKLVARDWSARRWVGRSRRLGGAGLVALGGTVTASDRLVARARLELCGRCGLLAGWNVAAVC